MSAFSNTAFSNVAFGPAAFDFGSVAVVTGLSIAAPVDTLTRVLTWGGLANAAIGDAALVADAREMLAMIVSGTLGVGGTVTWQGSADGVNWFTMKSAIAVPANVTQTALSTPTMLKERPQYVRPNVTGGDGTTSLTVSLVVRTGGVR